MKARILLLLLPCVLAAQEPSPEAKSLRDITGIERTPSQNRSETATPLVLACAALFVAALAVAFARWQKHRRRNAISPEDWARHELNRLSALELPAKGKADRLCLLLSNVVRAYIEKSFNIPARKRTTQEFLDLLAHDGPLTAVQQSSLRSFLDRCDAAKYTGTMVSIEACRQLIADAREFVQNTSCVKELRSQHVGK